MRNQGIHPYYAVKCDDARTSILWADHGMGIALVPSSIAKEYAQQQIRTIDYSQWQSKIQLVWRKNYRIKTSYSTFYRYFHKSFGLIYPCEKNCYATLFATSRRNLIYVTGLFSTISQENKVHKSVIIYVSEYIKE